MRLAKHLSSPSSILLDVNAATDRFTNTMIYFETTVYCIPGKEYEAIEIVVTELEMLKRFGIRHNLYQLSIDILNLYYLARTNLFKWQN
jgi:hypothetical protein